MELSSQISNSLPQYNGEVKIINCEMSACICNDKKANTCTLQKIHLNQNGLCQSCLVPRNSKDIFDKSFAKKLLQKIFGKKKKKHKK